MDIAYPFPLQKKGRKWHHGVWQWSFDTPNAGVGPSHLVSHLISTVSLDAEIKDPCSQKFNPLPILNFKVRPGFVTVAYL